MKKILFFALACVSLFSACADEDLAKRAPANPGDEISFGGATYGVADTYNTETKTRTVYGSLSDDRKKMPLNWVSGDVIGIYCPQASQPLPNKEVDYAITPNGDDASKGTMAKFNMEDTGLQWGTADLHDFYGIYPASAVDDVVNQNTIRCTLPLLQTPERIISTTISGQDGNSYPAYIAMPNMDYAYMWAHSQVSRLTNGDTPISLNFQPLVTALEIKVHGPEREGFDEVQVSQVVIQNRNALSGSFNLNINDGTVSPNTTGELNTMVTIPTVDENGDAITLKKGEVLVVVAFVLPTQNIDSGGTYVTVQMPGKGSRTKILDKDQIKAGLYNMTALPALIPNTGANFWMSSLDQRVYFSQLSIPGGHNCYSIDADAVGSNTIMEAYQTKTIEQQFDLGARAFSFMAGLEKVSHTHDILGSTISTHADWNPGGATDYEVYQYNGNTQGATLRSVLDSYAKLLTDKQIQYKEQQIENGVTAPRDAKDFIVLNINMKYSMGEGNKYSSEDEVDFRLRQQLTWLKEVSRIVNDFGSANEGLVVTDLSANTTLADLKGKIVILVNNQANSFSYTGKSYRADEWGYCRWSTNDYTYAPLTNALNYTLTANPMKENGEAYDMSGNDRDYTELYYVTPINSTIGTGSSLRFWKQHLERLSPPSGVSLPSGTTDYSERTALKIQMATQLMTWAVENNKTDGNTGNWYFNDLGGFSTVNLEQSYSNDYGESGNTVDAASRVNEGVFGFLSNSEQNAAPCGIVLMNFLGNETMTDRGSTVTVRGSSLPQLIIDNNFRFQLKINPDAPSEF